MAICDSNYCFQIINVRSFGKESDCNVFKTSTFGKKLYGDKLNFPPEKYLPNDELGPPQPFVLVADEALALHRNLLRPFSGLPVERFLEFIPKAGHKSAELFDVVNDLIKRYGLDWSNCKGQSYDNANNMSGSYSGLQARVKEINNLIYFVPCAAYSLNFVGTRAVDSSKEAVKYFGLMQHLFTFFTISTHRWEILSII
ncbi:hypothetical protein QTP88_008347 [Uroleucon formosanum]